MHRRLISTLRTLVWLIAVGVVTDIAAAQLPRPKKKPVKKVAPAPKLAPVLVTSTLPCTVSVDGKVVLELSGQALETIHIGMGSHLISAVSNTRNLRWTETIDVRDTMQKVITIEFERGVDSPALRLDGFTAVRISSGDFHMGCLPSDTQCRNDERPQHDVRLSNQIWMMSKEVTVAQFTTFTRSRLTNSTRVRLARQPHWNTPSRPVVNVTWLEARSFCEWIGGRLPSEAEWERAVRSNKQTIFPWGDRVSSDRADFGRDQCCAGQITGRDRWFESAPVGSFAPNEFGLYDMAGNVWEWTNDWYDEDYYQESDALDPRGPVTGNLRVIRGGSWADPPAAGRNSERDGFAPHIRFDKVGFRCVLDSPP